MAEVADHKPIKGMLGDIESSVNIGHCQFVMIPTHITLLSVG